LQNEKSLLKDDHRALGKIAHNTFLHESHLGNPILAIEDMHLSELLNVPKKIIVAPVRVRDSGGAPVTVIAER
jgi:kynurenine formamidase